MLTKIIIATTTLASSIALVFSLAPPATGTPTLGEILRRTAEMSLRLEVRRGDEVSSVVVQLPNDMPRKLRWQRSDTRYQIASGSTLWEIDEAENRVSVGRNDWFPETPQQLDLLALLQVETNVADKFRRVKSATRQVYESTDCWLYEFDTESPQPMRLEALVGVDSGRLLRLVAWSKEQLEVEPRGVPLAELRLLAHNVQVDDEQFVVSPSLSEDGRIGKVKDAQGIVTLRPMNRSRWTPVFQQRLLRSGDWLRTNVRGANAVEVVLTSQHRLILGPGSLLEFVSPQQVVLHRGEVKAFAHPKARASQTLQLISSHMVRGKQQRSTTRLAAGTNRHFRWRENNLQPVTAKPVWLAGFEGTTTNHSVGSLIAKVNGEAVPLTVGEHQVNVEIRDQIARTTIEETFVNHTNSQLEGTFYFPLPQDASISGFGMWINGKLVEADVVEKQRAREIYETILREKRDPALLEWSGGNLFKARVFPIPSNSEKRIRIVYTEVLPLRGNQYRYAYGLQSELLQKTPIRDLSLQVQIHSTIPLKSVDSPTHTVRKQQTTARRQT